MSDKSDLLTNGSIENPIRDVIGGGDGSDILIQSTLSHSQDNPHTPFESSSSSQEIGIEKKTVVVQNEKPKPIEPERTESEAVKFVLQVSNQVETNIEPTKTEVTEPQVNVEDEGQVESENKELETLLTQLSGDVQVEKEVTLQKEVEVEAESQLLNPEPELETLLTGLSGDVQQEIQTQEEIESQTATLETIVTQLTADVQHEAQITEKTKENLDNFSNLGSTVNESESLIETQSEEPVSIPPPSTAAVKNDQDVNLKEIGEKASLLKEHDVLEDEIAQADKIEEDLKKELVENDGWVKILGNDSLLKKVIKEGVDNKRPLRGETCTIRLEGRLQSDQSIFEKAETMTFQLGDAEVIPGLDLAVPLMSKGEISTVKVASRFGYSNKGLPPVIPANADLEYEVELLDFEIEKELEHLSVVERRAIGVQKRERGNWWYGRDEASLAIQCYRRALEFLDDVEGGISYPNDSEEAKDVAKEDLKQIMEERLKTYNNMAAAQLKLKAYDAALQSVESVLKCQPNNPKALFRKGKIHTSKGETDAALEAFRRVSELEPGTKAVLQEINQLQAKRKKEREGEKQLYQRMFKGSKSQEEDPSSKSASKRSFSVGLVIGGVVIALAGAMAYRYRFL